MSEEKSLDSDIVGNTGKTRQELMDLFSGKGGKTSVCTELSLPSFEDDFFPDKHTLKMWRDWGQLSKQVVGSEDPEIFGKD